VEKEKGRKQKATCGVKKCGHDGAEKKIQNVRRRGRV